MPSLFEGSEWGGGCLSPGGGGFILTMWESVSEHCHLSKSMKRKAFQLPMRLRRVPKSYDEMAKTVSALYSRWRVKGKKGYYMSSD